MAQLKRFSLRALIIIMTTIVCLVVKSFTDFINIAGALGSVTVAFILPQMFYFRVYGRKLSLYTRIGCYLIALVGVCGGTYSIYFSIEKLNRGDLT